MSVWSTFTLREVAEVFDGPHATPKKTDEGPWYLGISSLNQGRFDFSRSAHLAPEDLPRWTKRVMPKPGDTLFSYETRLGEAAHWAHSFDAALGRRMGLLRPDSDKVDPQFLTYAYLGPDFQATIRENTLSGATVDRIPVGDMPNWPIRLPDLATQRRIVSIIRSMDELIENSRRRVEVLEEMSRAMYREWFVKFRYPGHEVVGLVDSPVGTVPFGWAVQTVASVATDDRNAIAGGPFGSKLGRRDYRPSGVPVLRGTNLRVGGGFDESDFVFVSADKSTELKSAWARRGDIVVTQRGTLGQIGRIPSASNFDVYVLSQSQMKVTVDERKAAAVFVYMQLSSPDVTQRFVAQAITTGVPHVNLGILRDFPIAVPPLDLQLLFSGSVEPLLELGDRLQRESARLSELRDHLLPKLVAGQIDVSTFNLDAWVSSGSTGENAVA